ncbi:haloacid dehalogenase type II [Glaciimonas sp. Gout2]|uniref:haloacid dehalogenase type II n=1 Tax=unclassified Glaciimonas TaxID=2644401 RepID=UPI002AB568BA|nr:MULTISPECIES: haloacid dehalogenase type II [unclassified Glaciimonas]MDY7547737.1 haloacid dehalogenase type II [Glaciimonas sp. CA11.2]MEB0014404.1 haloacid dehalogenase type II [Glaciimonas sp. Cout2]MEB0082894.1 haloacid dehalogenase type II [Glaciimonas sp. Gout2]
MDFNHFPNTGLVLAERRRFLTGASAAAILQMTGISLSQAANHTPGPVATVRTDFVAYSKLDSSKIKALTFDMQGSLLDFYSTIAEEGKRFTDSRGIMADWTTISDQWRSDYRKQLDQVIAGSISWRSTDLIYRNALDNVLAGYDWGRLLSTNDRDDLSSVWSRLRPWADTRPGLERLRKKYKLSTLSNGSMASVVNIVKRYDLPFDCVLTAELVKSSKPDPKVYALAQNSLGLRPEEILMVACHKYDLAAAKKAGFHVAFIPRPLEFGPNGKVDTTEESYFDVMAPDLVQLAKLLAA